MNHVYRIERLCLGQTDTNESTPLSERVVHRAFKALQQSIEQKLERMPRTVSKVFTHYTQDGLDVRVNSVWDSLTIRNLLASVVSDINGGNFGLNLSLISKASTGWAPTLEHADGLASAIPTADEERALLDPVVPVVYGVAKTECFHDVA